MRRDMKILIPLDGSKFAEAVLKPTADLAATTKAEVHLIEVVRPSEAREMYIELSSPTPHGAMGAKAQVEERLYQRAQDFLNDVAQRFFPGGATSKIVISGSPAKEIWTTRGRRR
jgi:nucleotide-binding universal stress UspA family protein